MKLLVWNMAGGFGYDAGHHEGAWRFLQDIDPDVALVQEAVVPAWAGERWPFIHHVRRYPAPAEGADVPWGSAVIGRSEASEPFLPSSDSFPLLAAVGGSVAVARLSGPHPLWLASVHSNAYPVPEQQLGAVSIAGVRRCDPKDIWEIELIAHELEKLFGSGGFVAGGDLNSALLFDHTYGRTSNAQLFENLAAAGFVDSRQAFFADEQQTYFKAGKLPYQLDHVFTDAQTAGAVASWRVLRHVAAVDGLSDHAPVEVVLDL